MGMAISLILNSCAKNVADKNNDLGSGDKSNLPVTLASLIEHAEYCKAIYDGGGSLKDDLAFEVKQEGGIACHTGRESCFYKQINMKTNKIEDCEKVIKDPKEIYKDKK